MLKLLQMLEPRFDFKGTIIYQELEHPSEAIFLEKGRVDIGFAINKKSIYELTFQYTCKYKYTQICITIIVHI